MDWKLPVVVVLSLATGFWSPANAEISDRAPLDLQVETHSDRLTISRDALPVATYVFRDREILRPYFAHVHAPSGLQTTRNLPPREGIDLVDHPTMHPGIWLAFGDLAGSAAGDGDFWRNKGRVEHVEFVEAPRARVDGKEGVVAFAAKNRYVIGDQVVCYELARHTIRATGKGYLVALDSEFSGDEPFVFGDQEEMGLGVRLATPLTVKNGGTITSSEARQNEKDVWGRQADWCDYSGVVTTKAQLGGGEGKLRAGLLLVPHPSNFRRSWMHARDYGVLVANPFGQNAFTKGERSRIEVRPGEKLRLRFGVWSYAANLDVKVDLAAMAAEYVKGAGEP